MLKAMAWLGLFVGTPTVAAWGSTLYLKFVDPFLVLFVFSAAALVVAILPCLMAAADARSSARER